MNRPAIFGQVSWEPMKSKAEKQLGPEHISSIHFFASVNADHLSIGQADVSCANGYWAALTGRVLNWSNLEPGQNSDPPADRFCLPKEDLLPLLKEITGEFAVVVWDETAKTLHLAKDHLGTRPLFYVEVVGGVYFSGDPRKLLPYCENPNDLFSPKVVDYLTAQCGPHSTRTPISEIYRVEPGTLVTITNKDKTIERYWSPNDAKNLRNVSETEIYDLGRSTFQRVIEDRLAFDDRQAVHVSGGLDSSLIACEVVKQAKVSGVSLPAAVSWQPKGAKGNLARDQHFIEELADHLGLDVKGSEDRVSDHLDALNLDPMSMPQSLELPLEIAAQRSLEAFRPTLVFSGWGGDHGISCAGRSWKRALIPIWLQRVWSKIAIGKSQEKASFISGNYTAGTPNQILTHGQSVRNSQIAMLTLGHVQERMECWTIFFAARNIHFTFPMLDKRLIEFALGVPPKFYRKDGLNRNLIRQISKGIVPDAQRLRADKSDPARFEATIQASSQAAPEIFQRFHEAEKEPQRLAFVQLERLEKEIEETLNKQTFVRGKLARAIGFLLHGPIEAEQGHKE